MRAIVEGGEVIESLRDALFWATAAEDVVNPETRSAGGEPARCWTKTPIDELEQAGIDEVKVRTR